MGGYGSYHRGGFPLYDDRAGRDRRVFTTPAPQEWPVSLVMMDPRVPQTDGEKHPPEHETNGRDNDGNQHGDSNVRAASTQFQRQEPIDQAQRESGARKRKELNDCEHGVVSD